MLERSSENTSGYGYIGNNTLSKTQQQRKVIPKIDKWDQMTLKTSHQQKLCQSEQTASGKREKLRQLYFR